MDDGSSNKVVEDVAEEDPGRRGGPWRTDEADANEKAPRPSRRVASLDVFRGLTVALMILVDGAGGEWPVIGHAPWNGCNLADFVMPFFLFIVGMAVPLALKRIPDRGRAVRRVVVRTLKLLFWGILLQGYLLCTLLDTRPSILASLYSLPRARAAN
ncbi:Heparan-alpha-glucosaminide N-acetyltransferase [Zea mays]|uniref:Heparan-alpha-glucosaminide N-acetyltransferase n=1 Tax=Zea mays TaxID=4577 RepID=A0A1D6G4Y3_MAIZE|nr:Heparan-alpha-glucosaminide N-acetyltransferase [Zea mays]